MINVNTETVWIEAPSVYDRSLIDLLSESAARHKHLCPRQVLGARMGLLAAHELQIDLPRDDTRASSPSAGKRLLIIVETDGCFADGLSAATGCSIGHRTLRLIDHGKIAATFIDIQTGQAVRIAPHRESRSTARKYAPFAQSRWHAQLEAYQIMPPEELFDVQRVELTLSLEQLLSKPGKKAICDRCGEEIVNEREVIQDGQTLCRACAGESYFRPRGF
jgi:formylmethanofuran dehydrogenase subunit E